MPPILAFLIGLHLFKVTRIDARASQLARKQQLEGRFAATVSEIYVALGRTLAFRRWPPPAQDGAGAWPQPGSRYRCQNGTVLRAGRVVEIVRPVGATLKEILHDPPCRVGLTMRWRIEPLRDGCTVRLRVVYRLNHAALLRARHWDRRLALHFERQFTVLARHLGVRPLQSDPKRDLLQQ